MQGEHRVASGKIPTGSRVGGAGGERRPGVHHSRDRRRACRGDRRREISAALRPRPRPAHAPRHPARDRPSQYADLREQDEAQKSSHSRKRVLTYRAVRTRGWLYVRYRAGTGSCTTCATTRRGRAPGMTVLLVQDDRARRQSAVVRDGAACGTPSGRSPDRPAAPRDGLFLHADYYYEGPSSFLCIRQRTYGQVSIDPFRRLQPQARTACSSTWSAGCFQIPARLPTWLRKTASSRPLIAPA